MKMYKILKAKVKDVFKLYTYIRSKYKYTSLLESCGEYNDDTARYTIIGVCAEEQLVAVKEGCYLENLYTNEKECNVDWLEVLDDWTYCNENAYIATPYQLGAIGYIGYENKNLFEKIDNSILEDHDVPDVHFVRYSVMFVWDRLIQEGSWIFKEKEHEKICHKIESSYENYTVPSDYFEIYGDVSPDFDKDQYIKSINKTIEYICKGDIFQANITMRFTAFYGGDAFVLYKRLKETTPNPFFAFLDFDNPVISTSPERFIIKKGRDIVSNPIKGTIRCGEKGEKAADELQKSEKDIAENVMIVDLIRNDLGRICEQGSVKVLSLCGLKKFNILYHLESVICGKLEKNVKMSDILNATFPGGSITGAPKIRAMEIIEELEYKKRSVYCGMIGFWGTNGYMDSAISIRTIYTYNDRMFFHAGGGITVASEAEKEYEELLLKAESLIRTISEFNVLKKSRKYIDEIDEKILFWLNERINALDEITRIKHKYNISELQTQRMNSMVKLRHQCIKENNYKLSKQYVDKIYNIIIENSMMIERRMMENETLHNSDK